MATERKIEPFGRLYARTPRSPDHQATLDALGAYFTSRALHPYLPRVGGLTRSGRAEAHIGEMLEGGEA